MRMKLLAPFLFLFAAASAQGAMVITINIANPAAVVITGVANNSQISANLPVDFSGGVSFLGFFTQNESIPEATPVVISGNWKSLGATAAFDSMVTFAFNNSAVVPGVDLSIYSSTAASTDDQNLVTSAAPFSGSSVVNMSAFTHLPAVGATGSVNIGYLASHGGTIGQWQVIPEPSAALLGSLGVLGFLRRRR